MWGGGHNAKEAYSAKSIILKGKGEIPGIFSPTGDWFAGTNKPGIA